MAAAFVVVTLLAPGPLSAVDRALEYPWAQEYPGARAVLEVLVRLGQRAVALPVLVLVVALVAYRGRTWWPVLWAAGAVLALNLLVGAVKVVTARDNPVHGTPAFFEEGLAYPSGHAANAVLVYGLSAVLARCYWGPRSTVTVALLALTAVASGLMLVTGLYFRWHWFTDLVGGLLAGAVVLQGTVCAHRRLHGPTAGRDGKS